MATSNSLENAHRASLPSNRANGLDPLPATVARCLDLLEQAGFEAWLDGGYVRNCLVGCRRGHITLASNASPSQIEELFRHAGYAVHISDKRTLSATLTSPEWPHSIQVSSFHKVTKRNDQGRACEYEMVPTIEEDLARRDFTFNAIAFHPGRGLLDPYRGARDIRNRKIRFVGNAEERLVSEPLLALRAIRFASTLGFSIDAETKRSIVNTAPRVLELKKAYLRHQLDKLLCGTFAHDAIMEHLDFLEVLLPELTPMKGFDQMSRYHCYDVLEHTAFVVNGCKAHALNRWAALLHDSGKPETFVLDAEGRGHMPGHPTASLKHLKTVATRLEFDDGFTRKLALVIEHHDDRPAAKETDVRRLFENLDYDEVLFHAICDLMRADALAKAQWCQMAPIVATNEVEKLFDKLRAEGKI